MLARVLSCGLTGIEGFIVAVEADSSAGMPMFDMVGLPDAAVRESRERVRSAIMNSGLEFPYMRTTVNLAPADVKKEGPAFDLPIAVALLTAAGKIPAMQEAVICGELSLDGTVRGIRGALPIVISARQKGIRSFFLPEGDARLCACVQGVEVYPVRTLAELVGHITGEKPIKKLDYVPYEPQAAQAYAGGDLAYVRGQRAAKRALEIAAAGGHNILMVGPPGSGKTMMARCVPSILPQMTFEEALEVTKIHSVAGLASVGLGGERPFRAPHHTASAAALIGGGRDAMPGEISKAHNGVLFLDELPEFPRNVLEALRQPMEDGAVMVARIGAQVTYPARFMLVCSMNPCPCGNLGSRVNPCRCTPAAISRYLSRVSGPLLDRIDMHIEVESIKVEEIAAPSRQEESSAQVRERVSAARRIQQERYAGSGIYANAQLGSKQLERYCALGNEQRALLQAACERMGLSTRGYTRVLKVARTIADIAGRDDIATQDIAEAVQYRGMDGKYWG